MTKNIKKVKEENNAGYSKYVLIAVIVLVAGYFIYTNFIKEGNVTAPVFVDPKEKTNSVKEPQFRKEGELEFLSKDGGKVIKKIDVELAENDDERAQGLMFRKSMDDNKGMLFIFDGPEQMQSFWMKNTIMSLDIIYVNANKQIVKIYKNTTPYSENSLPSDRPAQYVVEVFAGFTDRYGIKDGDKINFSKL